MLKDTEENLYYQIRSQLEQYRNQSGYIKDLRRLKHDYSNQIKGLGYILENGEYEKVLEYIRGLDGMVNASNMSHVQFSNHNLIDAILQEVCSKAQDMEIRFEAAVQADKIPFTDLEVCTIFSNLMNNAIEACVKIEEKKRFIQVKSKMVNAFLVIKIINSFDGDFEAVNGKLKTLIKNKNQHGLGMEIVQKIVGEHGGDVGIRPNITSGEFAVFLFIPIFDREAESDKKQLE